MGEVDALDCRVSGKQGYGLQYSCGATGRVAGCLIDAAHMSQRGDILAGLLIESESDPLVEGNTVTGPFRNAVYCCDQGKGVFERNVFEGFTRFGVVLMSRAHPVVRGNWLNAAGARGAFAAPDRNDATAANMLAEMHDANVVAYTDEGEGEEQLGLGSRLGSRVGVEEDTRSLIVQRGIDLSPPLTG